MGPLILTYTGRHVNPLEVKPSDVCKEDIAHGLALINRFNGHTQKPITVAQHAVYVSRLLDGTGLEWDGLHHDDGEAYVGDMTKWLKESEAMAAFRKAEECAQWACYESFGVDPTHYMDTPRFMHPFVQAADQLMVRFEGAYGFKAKHWRKWCVLPGLNGKYPWPSSEEIERIGPWRPWSWKQAEEAWLLRFDLLADRPECRRIA